MFNSLYSLVALVPTHADNRVDGDKAPVSINAPTRLLGCCRVASDRLCLALGQVVGWRISAYGNKLGLL